MRLDFKGGLFRMVHNWNLLVPIGSGSISVVDGAPPRLVFDLNFNSLALATAVILGLAFGSKAAFEGRMGAIEWGPAVILWILLVGANYVISIFRFRRFLASIVSDVPHDTVEK